MGVSDPSSTTHNHQRTHARTQTHAVYERQATRWDQHRSRSLTERSWLDRLFARVRPGGKLLDLGCGSGEPISAYALSCGFQLTGLDFSEAMIALARQRHPEARWLIQDMRSIQLAERFDGIYSWDGSFHLTMDEQRDLLGRVTDLLHPGGSFMLTIGTAEGEVLGTVEGERVYHASLAPEEYRQRLHELGFEKIELVTEDPDCSRHSVLLATRVV